MRCAGGAAISGGVSLPLGVLDLIRGHYIEGVFQVLVIAPMMFLIAYWLYGRAQRG
jgi:hypothetical protein